MHRSKQHRYHNNRRMIEAGEQRLQELAPELSFHVLRLERSAHAGSVSAHSSYDWIRNLTEHAGAPLPARSFQFRSIEVIRSIV
jgi:hypothetical protein